VSTVTRGFVVLSCGHWLDAAVNSESIFQIGALVNCEQCKSWQAIRVVTG